MDYIRHFRAQAKRLLKDHKAEDRKAVYQVAAVLREPEDLSLQRAQHAVAAHAGFRDWSELLKIADRYPDLTRVMEEEPMLNSQGLGLSNMYNRSTAVERWQMYAEGRRQLRDEAKSVLWTAGWLRTNVAPIKTINGRRSSYGLKHIAERFYEEAYITNGAFVAAALIVGYPFKLPYDSHNPCFGMSERSIQKMEAEAQKR